MDQINKHQPLEAGGDSAESMPVSGSEPLHGNEAFARGVAFFSPYLFWITISVLVAGILLVG